MGCSDDEYTDVKGYYVKPHRRKKPKSGCMSIFLKTAIFTTDKILKIKTEILFINKIHYLNKSAVYLIKLYQRLTRNNKHKCIYHPTCSNFAISSYKKYVFITATEKTISRLSSCKSAKN